VSFKETAILQVLKPITFLFFVLSPWFHSQVEAQVGDFGPLERRLPVEFSPAPEKFKNELFDLTEKSVVFEPKFDIRLVKNRIKHFINREIVIEGVLKQKDSTFFLCPPQTPKGTPCSGLRLKVSFAKIDTVTVLGHETKEFNNSLDSPRWTGFVDSRVLLKGKVDKHQVFQVSNLKTVDSL